MASSVGDLWNNWIDGNFDLTGDGTESNPYQIEDLEDLMINDTGDCRLVQVIMVLPIIG